MSGAEQSEAALQEQIAGVVARLEALHAAVQELRGVQDRLRDEMDQAWEQYQGTLADLRTRLRDLMGEIARLESQKRLKEGSSGSPSGVAEQSVLPGGSGEVEPGGGGEAWRGILTTDADRSRQQAEAIHKDELCELVAYVLDDKNDPLLGRLGGLNRDPAVRLADMLELVPIALWARESRRERGDLRRRLARLLTWEDVLNGQLAGLRMAAGEGLRNDPRYEAVQERRKGAEAWRQFVEAGRKRMNGEITRQEAELARLRSEAG